jgi:Domain of unknown function (DUF4956)
MSVFFEMLPGFVLTFVTAFLILWFVYTPSNPHNQEYVVTFLSFNILLYFIIALLRDVQLSIGFGFGLLAVFSTLSYRSRDIPVKEMTYLFICITLPFINTLFAVTRISFFDLILVNGVIFIMILALEKLWGVPYQPTKRVLYEKIELIKPENYKLLVDDLGQRTGLDILKCEVEEIDFLHDTATIVVYYKEHT